MDSRTFLHHLEVLPDSDLRLWCCTLISLTFSSRKEEMAFIWYLVFLSGDVLLPPSPILHPKGPTLSPAGSSLVVIRTDPEEL